jgi:hypothetical protein
MKGPKITIEMSCMNCTHCKSRQLPKDDMFRCELLSNRIIITPFRTTPKSCPLMDSQLNKKLQRYGRRLGSAG